MSRNRKNRRAVKGWKDAVVCIEPSCTSFKIQFFDDRMMCKSCGNKMFSVGDVQREEPIGMTEDVEFSDDMFKRMAEHQFTEGRPGRAFIDGRRLIDIKSYFKKEDDDVFHCTPDVEGCPISKEQPQPQVSVPLTMYNKWVFLAQQVDTEWIAYLKGHTVEGHENEIVITDMYFPKQKVGPTHCEAVEEQNSILEGTIAAVHSHVGMNAFFSGEDKAHFNHPVELVVNNKGDIKAMGRLKLECGRFMRTEAKILLTQCDAELALVAALEAVASPETTTFTTKPAAMFQKPNGGEQKPNGSETNTNSTQQQEPHQQELPVA